MNIWIAVAFALCAALIYLTILFCSMKWAVRVTKGNGYFGRSLDERRKLKGKIARIANRAGPFVRLAARLNRSREIRSMSFEGVTGPAMICTPESYAATQRFEPDERDVFVATQMKCGTTWMQQVVYETLSRGKGDLSDSGHRHLYALSPWIEANASVSLEAAPRVGDRDMRIIKTHMPTQLCPYSPKARYVYVTRHPIACFGSTVDFIALMSGPLAPARKDLLNWFCSDRMWWRSWPEHVEGWWRWAEERPNVLFVHYEEMLADLPAVVRAVAEFLDSPTLSAEDEALVVHKSGFSYMKENEEYFEMAAPTPFQSTGSFLADGSRNRERQGADAERERIRAFCRERISGASYPLAKYYPDLH